MAMGSVYMRARTVAVIGAGPSGLAAAKYLLAEKAFESIVIFEQRSQTGGIWNYTGDQKHEDLFAVPQTDPKGKHQTPEWRSAASSHFPKTSKETNSVNGATPATHPSFLSPIYDQLETNIPRGLMGFQDLSWPPSSQLFPKHETVLHYIQDYGKPVENLIRFSTQVLDISPADTTLTGPWTVLTRNLLTSTSTSSTFDAVIIASGHFIVPYIPPIPNIAEWNARHPNTISHAKYYRTPQDFRDKKVIVVGNSASGSDISTQIAAYAQPPLLWSSKSPSPSTTATPTKRPLPEITRFHLDSTRTVEFADGTIESDIDTIVFATGYLYSLPFLDSLSKTSFPPLITDGTHVENTYQHIFYAPRPSLSLLTLPQRIIPFPLSEAQAAVVARVYAGRLGLPDLSTMRAWEEDTLREMCGDGDARRFHLLPFPKDADYINEMAAWAGRAEERDGLEDGGKGKKPPVWGKWEYWCRENFPAIRKAFVALGEGRRDVRSLEEVGFVFKERDGGDE